MAQRIRGSVIPPVRTPADEPELAVRVRGARRAYGNHVVLQDLDLSIAPGEFVAMPGHSGSGKSTLLRALAGLDKQVTGSLRVAPRRSVVFQTPRLLPWKKVLANVVFNLQGDDAIERGRRALEEVGLASKEKALPGTLSGGEAQRASLARALVREPQLLLLDEPFGALDALTRIKMYSLLKDLCDRHGPAVLHVTHDVDESILLADRVVVLDQGKITLDLKIELPTPRARGEHGFAAHRRTLLRALGVEERIGAAQGAP